MRVSVHGLGEVGRMYAEAVAIACEELWAIDVSEDSRLRGTELLQDYPSIRIGETAVPSDVHVIAVGTPLRSDDGGADLSQLRSAIQSISVVLRPDDVVILRSTVPPGCTSQFVAPLLCKGSGLTLDGFHLAYAPDRSLTGSSNDVRSLPQLFGLVRPESEQRVAEILGIVSERLILMESVEAAELAKLANNIARDVGMAVANAVAISASQFNLDSRRLIHEATLGYPREPIAQASPGVGGSCLPKDSYLLSEAISDSTVQALLNSARKLNDGMVTHLSDRLFAFGSRVSERPRTIVFGAAFKGEPETDDTRNSTGLALAARLAEHGLDVWVHDPIVTPETVQKLGFSPAGKQWSRQQWDMAVIMTKHPTYREAKFQRELIESLTPPALLLDPWQLVAVEQLIGSGIAYAGISHQIIC